MNNKEKSIDLTIVQTEQTKSIADTVGDCALGTVFLGVASGIAYLGIEYIPELIDYVRQNARIATEVVGIAATMATGLSVLGLAKLGFDLILYKGKKESEPILNVMYTKNEAIEEISDSLSKVS